MQSLFILRHKWFVFISILFSLLLFTQCFIQETYLADYDKLYASLQDLTMELDRQKVQNRKINEEIAEKNKSIAEKNTEIELLIK